jgi:hypothetical protein
MSDKLIAAAVLAGTAAFYAVAALAVYVVVTALL